MKFAMISSFFLCSLAPAQDECWKNIRSKRAILSVLRAYFKLIYLKFRIFLVTPMSVYSECFVNKTYIIL